MCSLQRNYDVIWNWERLETGPITVHDEELKWGVQGYPLCFLANRLVATVAVRM